MGCWDGSITLWQMAPSVNPSPLASQLDQQTQGKGKGKASAPGDQQAGGGPLSAPSVSCTLLGGVKADATPVRRLLPFPIPSVGGHTAIDGAQLHLWAALSQSGWMRIWDDRWVRGGERA